MGVFETIGDSTQKASDIGERYLKTSHQYFKLKAFKQLTFSLSFLLKIVLVGGLSLIGILFFSVSGALYLGKLLDSVILGCMIVGLVYVILAFIIFLSRSYIDRTIISKMALKFFK